MYAFTIFTLNELPHRLHIFGTYKLILMPFLFSKMLEFYFNFALTIELLPWDNNVFIVIRKHANHDAKNLHEYNKNKCTRPDERIASSTIFATRVISG